MAKILFISINDVNAHGIRHLSSVLKQKKHQSCIVFLKRYNAEKQNISVRRNIEKYDWVGIDSEGKEFRYSRGPEVTSREKNILCSLIKDIKPDLIGFSVTTPLRKRNAEISKFIKNAFNIPIIWGGFEPTVNPRDCLKDCDFVCTGEGEKTIINIANGIDKKREIKNIKNLAYLKEGNLVQNSLSPLVRNLNKLAFKDIFPDNKFLIEDNLLVRKFNETSYTGNFLYHIMSTRGCLYNCSYCCNSFYKNLYFSKKFFRRRSPSNVVKELLNAKKLVDYKQIIFEDEIFSFDCAWLRKFKDIYVKEVNLPLICYIYPNKDIQKQLEILKEAGLFCVCLALQSGSKRINKDIFNRPFSKALFLKTANLLKSMGIEYYTDVITYSPFETEKDLKDTLSILEQLPRPFWLCINKLYIMKGTRIYDYLKVFKKDNERKLVPNRIFNYYSRMFWLTTKFNKNN